MKSIARVGVIGLGRWGESHVQAFSKVKGAEVVAVCDVRPERLARVAEAYGIVGRYSNVDDMLAAEKLDLVSVVTHETDHFLPVSQALSAGVHVFAEHPFATNPAAAVELWKRAIERELNLFVPRLLRAHAGYRSVYEAIKQGKLGKLERIELSRSRSVSIRKHYDRLPTYYENLLFEMDIAFWLAGAVKFDRMQTFGSKALENGIRNIERLEFEFDNGVQGTMSNVWKTEGEGPLTNGSLSVIGDAGRIDIDTSDLTYLLGDPWKCGSVALPGGADLLEFGLEALVGELQSACDRVRAGMRPDYNAVKEANILVDVADTTLRSIDFKYAVHY
ncbi:Gfo/Idh/MocA family protein [Paenibacillus nasutitermitis]|uniref:Oxidoreductase n=1 Tax=Paenibacillus nasutitermitis TaxID=1652958 RepID=A0A916Z583_9BACL|nr:Gfo/Idh/MocA family oxidoreductase [Paenibacillus nasutitermitis]GGD76954.1 oxidoreductase [Paenibacillus nasutitermitis]